MFSNLSRWVEEERGMSLNTSYDVAEFENLMSLENPIKSSKATRWERKRNVSHMSGSNEDRPSLALSEGNHGSNMDRYIPNRSNMDMDMSMSVDDMSVDQNDFTKLVNETHSLNQASRVLAFKTKAPAPKEGYQNSLKILYSSQGAKKAESAKVTRHIPSAPVRILDAPALLNDYYLNLLSWSSTNVLAVALSETVYLWDASSGTIKELMSVDGEASDYISSISWIQQGGTHLAIGTASNTVQLWDVQAGKMVRSMDGHSSRVGALAWNNHIITSGSRDTTIVNHDVRVQQHNISTLRSHSHEVCGLAWSPDGNTLASGGNDNTLCLFDAANCIANNPFGHQQSSARFTLTDHQAAVKALAWSPHERNVLASGGGTADRCIKFWNAGTGSLLNSIDTGSQVCSLQWSPFEKEILSSHGYADNQLCLWKYPSMGKIKELKGHTSRVLHMATSPDGSLVCSAADETLRFWNVFASEGKRKADNSGVPSGLSRSGNMCLR